MNLASGVLVRLTGDATAPLFYHAALWSPNSERLAVTHARLGIEEIVVASGQILPQTKEPMVAEDWTPDGAGLFCSGPGQLFLLNAADLTHGIVQVVTCFDHTKAQLRVAARIWPRAAFLGRQVRVHGSSWGGAGASRAARRVSIFSSKRGKSNGIGS